MINPFITIDFTLPPQIGKTAMLIRLHSSDKRTIDEASRYLGISTAQFLRTAVILSARAVTANMNAPVRKRKIK